MHNRSLQEIQKEWHGSLRSYVIGFFLCLILTIISFTLVTENALKGHTLLVVLIALAIIQAAIQLTFFLHVGKEESKPRWATRSLGFMFVILLAVVIGSIWVMRDLNRRMMPNMDMNSEQMHMNMNHSPQSH